MDTLRGESQGWHLGTARRSPWVKLEMEEESQTSGWVRFRGGTRRPLVDDGLLGAVLLRLTKVSPHGSAVGSLGHEL